MSLQDKSEITSLRKSNDDLANKIKSLSKEIDAIKQDNFSYESQVADLKDQVSNRTIEAKESWRAILICPVDRSRQRLGPCKWSNSWPNII